MDEQEEFQDEDFQGTGMICYELVLCTDHNVR